MLITSNLSVLNFCLKKHPIGNIILLLKVQKCSIMSIQGVLYFFPFWTRNKMFSTRWIRRKVLYWHHIYELGWKLYYIDTVHVLYTVKRKWHRFYAYNIKLKCFKYLSAKLFKVRRRSYQYKVLFSFFYFECEIKWSIRRLSGWFAKPDGNNWGPMPHWVCSFSLWKVALVCE